MLSTGRAKNSFWGGPRSPTLSDWVKLFSDQDGARWAIAGTITFREFHPVTRRRRGPDIPVSVAKTLLARVNKRLYNHRAKRHGATVASLMILGTNLSGEVTHLHFVLGSPPDMEFKSYSSLVERVIRKIYWCDREFDLQPYRDRGWLRYILAHGTEKLVIECCFGARS
jgi:hypothetical protein